MLTAIDPGAAGACVRLVAGGRSPVVDRGAVWRTASDGRLIIDYTRARGGVYYRARVHHFWEIGSLLATHVASDGDALIVEDAFLHGKSRNPASSFAVAKRGALIAAPICPIAAYGEIGWVHPSTWRACVLTASKGSNQRAAWKHAAMEQAPGLVENWQELSGQLGSSDHLCEATGLAVSAYRAICGQRLSKGDVETIAQSIRSLR